MKNNHVILNFLKDLSNKIYKLTDKLSKFLRTKQGKNSLKLILRLVLVILFIQVAKLIAHVLNQFGIEVFNFAAATFKSILSLFWSFIIYYSYVLFSVLFFYIFLDDLSKEKEILEISKDKKTQTRFMEALQLLKRFFEFFVYLVQIPLILIIVVAIVIFSILINYAMSGVFLISLFFLLLSIILFASLVIVLITAYLKERYEWKKLIDITVTLVVTLFVASLFFIAYETRDYDFNENLTDDFALIDSETSYNLNNSEYSKVRIIVDRNVQIVKDENIKDKVVLRTRRAETSNLAIQNEISDDKLNVELDYDLNLRFKNINQLSNLLIKCIEDKTIYNYQLLKYGQTQIMINPDDIEKIIVVQNDRND